MMEAQVTSLKKKKKMLPMSQSSWEEIGDEKEEDLSNIVFFF